MVQRGRSGRVCGSRGVAMKTRAEVDDLKARWKADPCWDIEFTEGFEDHIEELRLFQEKTNAKWEEEYDSLVKMKAKKLNCSFETASYFLGLEARLDRLEILTAGQQ
jgi:hypothetical protein